MGPEDHDPVNTGPRDLRKAARRGEPSYLWRAGQERRLDMILTAAKDHSRGWVLDNGCGVGQYLQRLTDNARFAVGLEFDLERARVTSSRGLNVVCAKGEYLPFPSGSFDFILSHEVLEHVGDDRRAVGEMCRALRPADPASGLSGGRIALFLPNRGYPFETHGMYWRGKYHFGNVPLINYLPRQIRNRWVPHVRTYSEEDVDLLIAGLPLRIVNRMIIFGGYDNIIARWPRLGRFIRGLLQSLEDTPLQRLGLSHFWTLEREPKA